MSARLDLPVRLFFFSHRRPRSNPSLRCHRMDPLFWRGGALRPVCVPAALACRLIYMLKSYVKFPCSPFLKQEMKSESAGLLTCSRSRGAFPFRVVRKSDACRAGSLSKELTAEDAVPDFHRVPFSVRQSGLLSIESPTRGQM